jgi:hypothetical protein
MPADITATEVAFLLVAVVVTATLVSTLRNGRDRNHAWRLAATLRPRHFVANLPAIAITVSLTLLLLQVPGLGWGWTQLIGGRGNIMLGLSEEPSALTRLIPFVILPLLVAAMPLIVKIEEELFRSGSEHRSRGLRLAYATTFGLIHLSAGVPIAAALALVFVGLWFTNRYLSAYRASRRRAPGHHHRSVWADDGLTGAFHAHLAWNFTMVGLLAASAIAGLF